MTKITEPSGKKGIDSTPSKSQRKRDMKELQNLGKELVEAPQHLTNSLNLEDDLNNAIILARHLGNDKSIRRQLQYIGKLLSHLETEEIKKVLDAHKLQHQKSNKAFHDIEKWRDKLINDGDAALDELLNQHSNLDRQHLRQLIRNAQKEKLQNKPPASSRIIFTYLKNNIESNDSV